MSLKKAVAENSAKNTLEGKFFDKDGKNYFNKENTMKLKDVEKALKEILQLIQDKAKIKKEIDSLIIQREDIARDVEKEKKKAVKEVATHKGSVNI